MKEWLAEFLKPFADQMLSLVLSVPLPMVRWFFLGLLAILALWVISLPAQQPETKPEGLRAVFTDLRLFAVGLLLLQSIFYLIF
ncbi:MAG TPA: hypothetical protein VM123_06735 [archaeon]|nr:hypothetical protein [archaeon]